MSSLVRAEEIYPTASPVAAALSDATGMSDTAIIFVVVVPVVIVILGFSAGLLFLLRMFIMKEIQRAQRDQDHAIQQANVQQQGAAEA